MSRQTELLAAALAHASRGWYVFPLWPGSKTPAVPDSWERRATRDPATIRRWWAARPFNIGIAVGPSGLIVIDLDTPKPARTGAGTSVTSDTSQVTAGTVCVGSTNVSDTSATSAQRRHGRDVFVALCAQHGEPIPATTLIVATPSNGWHLYYRHPPGPKLRNTKGGTARSLGEAIDTRAHGGYVVAPASVVNGRDYRVVRNHEPVPFPGWLTNVLRHLDRQTSTPATVHPVAVPLTVADRRGAFLRAALTREAEHVRAAPNSRGNAVLWGAAVALGQLVAGGELTSDLVTEVLEQAATAGGRRTVAEARATIRSGLRRGAQRPRTVAS
ncbi:bifunctional DNA primase/polymerase [Salinispora arenicola]|uniref:bifunctional DNA primase/polymerase n=1 Tax=Salinispora arenicola TaxID=168697 RepID=UPI0004AF34E5|nr:bifunctional DNA primase/polymerase [Salinispora arenicola]